MDRSLLHHYLETSGMEAAQARTLSQILAQTVTRDDLTLVDERLHAMQDRMDARLLAMDQRLDMRLRAMDERLDARLLEFQHTLEISLHQVRNEMSEMEKRLLWRFVALLGGFAAVVTALDRLLG